MRIYNNYSLVLCHNARLIDNQCLLYIGMLYVYFITY